MLNRRRQRDATAVYSVFPLSLSLSRERDVICWSTFAHLSILYTNNNISVTPACGHLADAQSPSFGHVFGGQAEAALPIWYMG